MKKYNEMNGFERIAYKNTKAVAEWELGGWYNCILDNQMGCIPATIEEAKSIVYDEAMNDAAGCGWFRIGRAPKEMRFAGSDFVKEVIDHIFATDCDADEIADTMGW